MDTPEAKPPLAWQPITPPGVAAFARASLGRLLLVQFLVALAAAGVLVWFLSAAWFPVIATAIRHLPATGEIRSARLGWHGESPTALAEGSFLALAVDLTHQGEARSPAHIQVEFGSQDVEILSLFGFLKIPYPQTWVIAFNRVELQPWWGAWAPEIRALGGGGVVGGLMLVWSALATIYFVPAWIGAFFANRQLTLRGSWQLAGAALLPGALFQTGAVMVYGLGGLDLVRLLVTAGLHLAIGWIYLGASVFCLPRHPAVADAKPNPFDDSNRAPSTGEH